MLSKDKLYVLADEAYKFIDINRNGSLSTEIFDNLPLCLLKIFNQRWAVNGFFTPHDRARAFEIYKTNAGYISGVDMPNEYQWKYLSEYGSLLKDEAYIRMAYANLSCVYSMEAYEAYISYLKAVARMGERYPHMVLLADVFEAEEGTEVYESLLHNTIVFDDLLDRKRNHIKYIINNKSESRFIAPSTISGFIRELILFGHAYNLEIMTDYIVGPNKDVIFVDTEDEQKPYALLFVDEGVISDIGLFPNKLITKENVDCIKKFAKENNFLFSDKTKWVAEPHFVHFL